MSLKGYSRGQGVLFHGTELNWVGKVFERGECLKHWKTHGILERVVQQQQGVDSVEKAGATIV